MIMKYFDDIHFILAREIPCCTVHVDQFIDDHYSLEFLASGKMYFSRDGRTFQTLYAPCLHWHVPGQAYHYGPAGKNQRWRHIFFTCRGLRAQRVIEGGLMNLSSEGFLVVYHRDRILRLFREIVAQISSRRPGYVPKSCACIEELLALLEAEKRREDVIPNSRQIIQSLLKEIALHPTRDVTAATTAEEAGLSTSHFRKLFRTYTGKPFHHYLLETRMHYVARQLADPDITIKELAEQLGYTELSDFSRAFRRVVGISPRRYRESLLLTDSRE